MKIKKIAIALCVASVITSLALVGCGNKNAEQKEQTTSLVRLDFNPSIQLELGANNEVLSVIGKNEDGFVLLYKEDGIVGQSVDKAIDKIVQLGKKLGYISEQQNSMNVFTLSKDDNAENMLKEKVSASIKTSGDRIGVRIKTHSDGTYSLNRKLGRYKLNFPNNKKLNEMSLARFNWVYTASESGDISIDSAIELDRANLIKEISKAEKAVQEFSTTAFTKAKEGAQIAYDIAEGGLVDGLYTRYYMRAENLANHPDTCWYGMGYQVYKSMARSFNGLAKNIKHIEDLSIYELNEEQTQRVLNAFNLSEEQVDLIKNSDGKVTLGSVEDNVDKILNSQKSSQLENSINQTLADVEREIMVGVNEILTKNQPQIISAIQTAEKLVDGIPNDENNEILVSFKKDFNDVTSEVKKMIEGKQTTYREMLNLYSMMEEKANDMLDKIKNDLGEEKFENLRTEESEIKEKLGQIKNVMMQTISKAEKNSKARLEKIKEDRIKLFNA